ncbi:hypothetical protein TrCOL_g11758 [Triparma columacea]|nr:hypothetical protein TrCOL_g11758 [Triparma columacea]
MDSDDFIHVPQPPPSSPTEATPPPVPTLTLKLRQKNAVVGLNSTSPSSTQYVATVTASSLVTEEARSPVDISVALDVSGSMSGSKLDLCKKTLRVLISELKATDRLSLCTFSDDAKEVFPLTALTQAAKEDLVRKVGLIRTTGCTNISGGLGMSVSSLLSSPPTSSSPTVRSVLLLTDGHANRGISEPDALLSLVKGMIPSNDNISINTFGYGSDHNADLLKGISEATKNQGSYYFVESEDNVSSAFGDCLGGLMSVAAQNIKLTIMVDKSDEEGKLSFDIAHPSAQGGGDDRTKTLMLGDVFAEEVKDFIVNVTYSTSVTSEVVVSAKLNYLDITRCELVESPESQISTSFVEGTAEMSETDKYVLLQGLRVKVYETLEAANNRAKSSGEVEAARKMITDLLAAIKADTDSLTLSEEERRSVSMYEADLRDALSSMVSYDSYQRTGSKFMMKKMQSHAFQRCNESDEMTANAYRGSSKMAYASRMKGKMGSMFGK